MNKKQLKNEDEKTKKNKEIAKQLLREIGIKVHRLGFKYWTTALSFVVENDKDNETEKMMQVYYQVARKHKTTQSKVEKAMRYAYESLDLKQRFNVDYSVNNTALLFLLKEEVIKRI